MKVLLEQVADIVENQVIIQYETMDKKIHDLIKYLKKSDSDKELFGSVNKELYILDREKIFYVESFHNEIFIYGEKEVYQSSKRLYELEDELENYSFFRASKSLILNIKKIKSVKPLLDGRFEANLINGETVYISRKYVPILKKKLGL